MQDSEFLAEFEAATVQPFGHPEHIRMAWLYLYRDGWDVGFQTIQDGLIHFAAAFDVSDRYHVTLTRFWASLVQHYIDEQPEINNFEAFSATFPNVMDKNAMLKHYSAGLLWSDLARHSWQEPDLLPMPTR